MQSKPLTPVKTTLAAVQPYEKNNNSPTSNQPSSPLTPQTKKQKLREQKLQRSLRKKKEDIEAIALLKSVSRHIVL